VILVDTSAWVEYDRATGSPADLGLTDLIASGEEVAVTEPVVMEVLAGARDGRRERDLRRLMERFELIRFDPVVHFEGAVRIYRGCRAVGITPRGLIDCMIAAVAAGSGTPVLAHDRDFARLAEAVDLTLAPGSLGAEPV
jgi:predicted nucleic acid-binding protein